MLHRLMLGGTLIMLLATSSLAREPVGAHCEFDRQCASRNCKDGVCRGGPHPSGPVHGFDARVSPMGRCRRHARKKAAPPQKIRCVPVAEGQRAGRRDGTAA